jgi:L-threonylcarbamoyladenylate synthase
MKETKCIYDLLQHVDLLKEVGEAIRLDKTVVFPTETVYGLGANGLSALGVDGIYEAKGRPSDNPLILHICSLDMLKGLTDEINEDAARLMEAFWPGPLTLVFKKTNRVPLRVTGGLDTVAVRMPRHPIALAIIEASGVPIAAPSANLSGKPSPTRFRHVFEDLDGRVDYIIVEDTVDIGLESTVCDVTGDEPVILRPGSISLEDIVQVTGKGHLDPGLIPLKSHEKPKSPGMKYTHYAPEVPLILVEGSAGQVLTYMKALQAENMKLGYLLFQDTLDLSGVTGESLGNREDLDQVAEQLFKNLRHFKATDYDKILCEIPKDTRGIGEAIRNRLLKAAGHSIVTF